jgi:uncharacterized protein DUF3515
MADAEVRRAARIATLVALPIAVIAGLVAFFALRPGTHTAAPKASASPHATATTPVTMAAPSLSATRATVCRAFVAALPDQVRDLPQRRVSAGAEQNAAYGDPPITVACGVTAPQPQDQVYSMGGVCWWPVQLSDRSIWTTTDRTVPVSVVIPTSYQEPGQWANEFSAAVIASVPSIKGATCGN